MSTHGLVERSLGKLKENFSPQPAVTKQLFQTTRMKGSVFPRLSVGLLKKLWCVKGLTSALTKKSQKEGSFDVLCDVSSRLQLS